MRKRKEWLVQVVTKLSLSLWCLRCWKVNTFEAHITERGVPSVYGTSVQSNEKLFRSWSSERTFRTFRTVRTRVNYERERYYNRERERGREGEKKSKRVSTHLTPRKTITFSHSLMSFLLHLVSWFILSFPSHFPSFCSIRSQFLFSVYSSILYPHPIRPSFLNLLLFLPSHHFLPLSLILPHSLFLASFRSLSSFTSFCCIFFLLTKFMFQYSSMKWMKNRRRDTLKEMRRKRKRWGGREREKMGEKLKMTR